MEEDKSWQGIIIFENSIFKYFKSDEKQLYDSLRNSPQESMRILHSYWLNEPTTRKHLDSFIPSEPLAIAPNIAKLEQRIRDMVVILPRD